MALCSRLKAENEEVGRFSLVIDRDGCASSGKKCLKVFIIVG